jgi:hypothetical protein
MNKKVKLLIICIVALTSSSFAQNELNNLSIRQREVTVCIYNGCGGYTASLRTKRVKLFVVEKNRKDNQISINTFLPTKMIFKKIKRHPFTIVTPNYYQNDLGFVYEKPQWNMVEIPLITFKEQKQETKSTQEEYIHY